MSTSWMNKSVDGGSYIRREGNKTRYRIDRQTITVIVVIAYRTERKWKPSFHFNTYIYVYSGIIFLLECVKIPYSRVVKIFFKNWAIQAFLWRIIFSESYYRYSVKIFPLVVNYRFTNVFKSFNLDRIVRRFQLIISSGSLTIINLYNDHETRSC